MVEMLLLGAAVWGLLLTWGVVNLYTRPSPTLPDDEIEVLRTFVERLRALAKSPAGKAVRRGPKVR